jgi:hypothetical protein
VDQLNSVLQRVAVVCACTVLARVVLSSVLCVRVLVGF